MSYISLAKFTLSDDPIIGEPSWKRPARVTALIDLTPPSLEAINDDNPLTNHAICLSDEPLDSNDAYYTFGTGHPTEIGMSSSDRSAWESITGYYPASNTLADCLAEHLLQPPGTDRVNPLTCEFNRELSIQLGESVWSHRLTGLDDPYTLPVMLAEAEGLAKIFLEQGETQYRLAKGSLRLKYRTEHSIDDLIAHLFPGGREDLPLNGELIPQTIKAETWPSAGVSDQTWATVTGSWAITTGKVTHTQTGSGLEYYRLDYAFGGNDRDAIAEIQSISGTGNGVVSRGDSSVSAIYFAYQFDGQTVKFFKRVSGTNTQLADTSVTVAVGNTYGIKSVGSNHKIYKNGSVIGTAGGYTDTAITTGTYSVLIGFQNTAAFGPATFDDLVSGSSSPVGSLLFGRVLTPGRIFGGSTLRC